MPKIVLYPQPVPEVVEIAEGLLPTGFTLKVVSPGPTLVAALAGAEFLAGFVGPLPEEAWQAASSLRLIQLLSAGYDNFQIDRARRLGVPVATNGGANALAVAEHAVMLMLAVYRHLPRLDQQVRTGTWLRAARGEVRYHELGGKRVGILGMGRIGQRVAHLVRAFDAEVFYSDVRRLPPDEEARLGATFLGLDELLDAVDVLSLHLPLLPETRGVVGEREIALLAPGSIVINTARGELVDEAALARALREGKLAGAGLDVLSREPPAADNPLLVLDNVVLTPHSAGPTWESWPRRFANAFANIGRVAGGEPPLWVIPELEDLVE